MAGLTFRKYNFLYLPVILLLAVALLNSNAFGSDPLISYFFTLLCSLVIISFFSGKRLFTNKLHLYIPPYWLSLLLVIALSIFIQGLLRAKLGLTHYYWLVTGLFAFVFFQVKENAYNKISEVKYTQQIHKGILILAMTESSIVLLQCTGVLGTPSEYFLCTGTWANPNVSATFLAFSLYSALKLMRNATRNTRWIYWSVSGIIIVSIFLLQCRTALAVASILMIAEHSRNIFNILKRHLQLNWKGAMLAIVSLFIVLAVSNFIGNKSGSASARLRIWGNAAELFSAKPIFGHGFGQFERVYNLHTASKNLPVNDHVNMAYNDFLELSVEGGIIFLAAWAFTLFLLTRNVKEKGDPLDVMMTVAFIVASLINFEIQAIPVYFLFLVYSVLASQPDTWKRITFSPPPKTLQFMQRGTALILLGGSAFLFLNVFSLMKAFDKQADILEAKQIRKSIPAFNELKPTLYGYASFHEAYGTSLMRLKQYNEAIHQFNLALGVSSGIDLLTKTGYCYQQIGNFDSSEYYLKIAQKIQPHRFYPRLVLLHLYEKQKNTPLMLSTARTIVDQPVKVRSNAVYEIKQYAKHIVDSISTNHPDTSNNPKIAIK